MLVATLQQNKQLRLRVGNLSNFYTCIRASPGPVHSVSQTFNETRAYSRRHRREYTCRKGPLQEPRMLTSI
ncbi:hypothetical protein KSB_82300 [Ktedonobacter robiniae]|uniref:Uncharacterized protein n=1 Tax=Ktedonobacter robiniae TaxID=2778365 RepID=A0ABQ3V5M0_9CHLR|nr:hypothetical protein KSB_82300 [Ktedonobacter robiniae]